MNAKKTDNHNPAAKLELRRYFLRQLRESDEPIRVLDCFQGSGSLWIKLRGEFPVQAYWGVDVKPKKGRLKIDSARILEQAGWTQNVIDLDAYGSPWKHWKNLIATCRHSVTVFITIGMVKVGGGNYDHAALEFAGIKFDSLTIPNSLGVKIAEGVLQHALAEAERRGLRPVEIIEAFPQKNARYLGVRLEKVPTNPEPAPPLESLK